MCRRSDSRLDQIVIAHSPPLRLYLGPVPNPAGLTVPVSDAHKASHDDMRHQYRKNTTLAQAKNLLKLAADWADTNRAAIAGLKAAPTPVQ